MRMTFTVLASLLLAATHVSLTPSCGFADESPSCRVVPTEGQVMIESPSLAFHLDTRDGLHATRWENRLAGTGIGLGNGPELEVDIGQSPDAAGTVRFIVTKLPRPSAGDSADARFELAGEQSRLSAVVRYRCDSKQPVLHKFVEITNAGDKEIRLLNVRLGTYSTDAKLIDREQGFPVYLDDAFFMSLAHPAGWATAKDGKASLRQYPGMRLAPGAKFRCMEAVYGVGRAGEARKQFVAHVRSRMRRVVRRHDKPYAIFDNFGSWPSGASGNWLNSEEIEMHSLRLLAKSQKAAGCHFDFCNIHFWVDPVGDIKRWNPDRFPHGIANIKALLDTLGTAPGLWIDSSNSWGAGWSLLATEKTRPSLSHEPSWFCRASEPIKSMFRDAFIHHIREEGVRELKFDNLHTLCNNPKHDHLPGAYSTEAIENSVIEFLHDLDKECPDMFILLYWGYRSPWWLLHGDTLFDSGIEIEAASPASQPAPYARESVAQKLDQAQRHACDVPVLGKDSLGIWLSDWAWNSSIGKEHWQEGVIMDLCRGSLLLQIWSDHEWLSPPEWRQLADFLALLRAQPKCFGNPRFILGNPWKDEPYGYCCTDGRRAFVALHNCTWQDRSLPLELNSAWGLPDRQRWDLYRWHPNPARLTGNDAAFGPKTAIRLRPFQVVLLEAVPAGQPPTLNRRFARQLLPTHFAEASQTVALTVHDASAKEDPTAWTILEPSSAVSAGGATLTKQADGSILAGGKNPSPDTYTVMADSKLTGITGIRLEVLDDPRLPSRGPGRAYNGNFALREFKVSAAPIGKPAEVQPIRLQRPSASFSQVSHGGWPIAGAIDGDPKTAWSIDPREGLSHTAVFETQTPLAFPDGVRLAFTLDQGYGGGPPDHTIGRFRLSVTTAKPPIPPPVRKDWQRFAIQAQSPATAQGGTLVITAELKKGTEAVSLGNIGTCFSAEAKLAGQPIVCQPVLGKATYPSCWQAWRISIAPSAVPQPVEASVSVSAPVGTTCQLLGHFVPVDAPTERPSGRSHRTETNGQ
jgi:hypothetical protein